MLRIISDKIIISSCKKPGAILLLFIVLYGFPIQSLGQPHDNATKQGRVNPLRFVLSPHDAILLPSPWHPMLFGPYFGPDFTVNRGEFQITENGIPCCTFEEGTGLGYTAGMKIFFPLGGKSYVIPRIAYTRHNGSFESLPKWFPFRGTRDSVELTRFRDELTAPLPTLAADLFFSYQIDSGLGLYVAGGPALEYITRARFSMTETIAEPDGVTFIDGSTTREIEIDYIEEASQVVLGARAGLFLLYPITDFIYLNPELTVSLPVTVINDNWRMFEVQGTVGLMFAL